MQPTEEKGAPTPERLTPARCLEIANTIPAHPEIAGWMQQMRDELRAHAAYLETLDEVLKAAQEALQQASWCERLQNNGPDDYVLGLVRNALESIEKLNAPKPPEAR